MPILNPTQLLALRTQIAPAAVASETATRCPAALSAAQCCLESGWLAKMPPGSNNGFGVKAVPGQPGVTVLAEEYQNGKLVTIPQTFAAYPNLAASFAAHARLITQVKVYQPYWLQYLKDHDLGALIDGIAPHYAPGNAAYAPTVRAIAFSRVVTEAIEAVRKAVAGY